MLTDVLNILRDNFITVRDKKKIAKSKMFLKKCEETVVKPEHFYFLVVKGLIVTI